MGQRAERSRIVTLRVTLALAAVLVLGGAASAAEYFSPQLLVDVEWLEEYGGRPGVRILDFRESREDYDAGHIPGAAFVDRSRITTTVGGIPTMLAHAESVVEAIREAGVGSASTVVVYDDSGGLWASRLFWALEYLGHEDVRLLDGGWAAWNEEVREIATVEPYRGEGDFTPCIRSDRLATRDWILKHLDDPCTVFLDVRTPGEYTGVDARAERGGHIPGAVNVDWVTALTDDGSQRILSANDLKALYGDAGVTPAMEAVTYCQGGVRAAHTYFVLRLMGYPWVRMYDASWAEWGNDADVPAAGGETSE